MEGQRLGGRYQLEERIGGGGMAIVYKAKDLLLHRQVAVKVLRPQFGVDDDFVNRFRREAQAVASLSHPNVVSVYDVGEDEDIHYIVMEYIDGSTLKDVINTQGALPVAEAVRIAVQVCDALDHAHQNKIIHRDIKPHNILIGSNGRVKVTDFGIARAVTAATITHTNSVLGSVHYFSPEQARGGYAAEKSDIYSLGIVLYEMVTGKLPFSGDSPITVALKHLQEPLPEPRQIRPEIPQSVENIILRALAKDPFQRYASAREMLQDLETCLSPARLNEPKLILPDTDDEQTKVIPAITEEMLARNVQERELQRRRLEDQDEEEPQKSRWWVKAVSWLGAGVLFLILAVLGFETLPRLFEVPEINVPHVAGTPQAIAEAKIREAKLVPQVTEQFSDDVEEGLVISQDPAPPMRVKENATVMLVVSKGKQRVEMPNLLNSSRTIAEETLRLKGFAVSEEMFEEREHEDAPPGVVIEQHPPAGEQVVPGEANVRIVISKGQEFVTMPDLRGRTVEEARVILLKEGLKAGPVREEPTYAMDQAGLVISTHPYDPGMEVEAGQEIPLTVSSGTYPPDAKIGTIPVYVEVTGGETAEIRIVLNDARGNNQVVFAETISESKEYHVPVVLSPDKNGMITVFKHGRKNQEITIQYNSLP